MPWPGDPRINMQAGDGGKAKPYQVRQAVVAIDTLLAPPQSEQKPSKTKKRRR
jgi:hypothetical protein